MQGALRERVEGALRERVEGRELKVETDDGVGAGGAFCPSTLSFRLSPLSRSDAVFPHASGLKTQVLRFRVSSAARPAGVVRYCCLLLRGFSGIVISRNLASNRGFNTCCRNLVRSFRFASSIKATIADFSRHFSRI